MIGARSGNRGSCAQPCRLPLSVNNQKGGHALSLKDNSIVNYLGELQNMGVASAKIEGRMKRPEYVSAAVRACVEPVSYTHLLVVRAVSKICHRNVNGRFFVTADGAFPVSYTHLLKSRNMFP